MQADGRLFQQIERRFRLAILPHARVLGASDAAGQFAHQLEALRFAAAERRAGLAEFEIAEPGIAEQRERAGIFWCAAKNSAACSSVISITSPMLRSL